MEKAVARVALWLMLLLFGCFSGRIAVAAERAPRVNTYADTGRSSNQRGKPSLSLSSSLLYQSGDTALLPCDISVPQGKKGEKKPGDELILIMWYREDVQSPIYSIDARTGVHIPTVNDVRSHRINTNLLGPNRVVFDTSPGPSKARLKIYNVSQEDDGLYRCRVDFKASQTRTSRMNLTVIVRPSKPLIRVQDGGEIVQGYLGPYQIGTTLTLQCQVIGGKPRPRVTWYRNNILIPAETWSSTDPDTGFDTTNANLTLDSLHRNDVHTRLTCETSNFDATVLRTSVELDLKYQAHNVSIVGKTMTGSLNAGAQHEFRCIALGSRPAAQLTWWFDDKEILPQIDGVHVSSSNTDETTTSTLTYTPRAGDSGKTLRCRATNPEMQRGVLEDAWTLDVQYPPRVSIELGKNLEGSSIRQGIDVYFHCLIEANPLPRTKLVTWLHNGEMLRQNRNNDPRARMVLPSVNDPNILVLQGVKKSARGNYSCRVGNGIPHHDYEVQSDPIFLDVKFPPVCAPKDPKVYGVAKMETAHIPCRVEANPPEVRFRWTFNNSAEAKQVEERFISTNGSLSVLSFTPARMLEYGTLMCWSKNVVGEQKDPCVFHIIAAGKPEAVHNCTVENESTDSFQVNCLPGFNGGLPQQFSLAVYKVEGTEQKIVATMNASSPSFSVGGLQPGSNYIGEIMGYNVKGMGVPFTIRVYTLKLPEKLIPPIAGEPSQNNAIQALDSLHPWVLTLLGIGAGVLVVIILVAVFIRVHAARSRLGRSASGSARGGRCTESATNKVVVTTIEELDLDHAAATQGLMLLDHQQAVEKERERAEISAKKAAQRQAGNPELTPFTDDDHQRFETLCSTDLHSHPHPHSHSHNHNHIHAIEHTHQMGDNMSANPGSSREYLSKRSNSVEESQIGGKHHHALRPPPPPRSDNPQSQMGGVMDFCTMRRQHPSADVNNDQRPRGVQFADQMKSRPIVPAKPVTTTPRGPPPAYPPTPPVVAAAGPGGGFMYATLRTGQRGIEGATFHEFVPPPPPMFESAASVAAPGGGGGGAGGVAPPPATLAVALPEEQAKKLKKKTESTV